MGGKKPVIFFADPDRLYRPRHSLQLLNSRLVPLNAVASITPSVGPLTVNHYGQVPAVTISFNLKPGVALGEAVNAVRKAAGSMLSPTINTSVQGAAQAFESSM